MEEAFASIQRKLIAQVSKNLQVDPLHVETGLVLGRFPLAERGRSFLSDRGMRQKPRLGQDRLGTCQDLGQAALAGSPDDGVPALNDPDVGFPAVSGNAPMASNREPVGVNRAVEDLEGQV